VNINKEMRGRVIKLGDNIDTDIIIPTQYMTLPDIASMRKYAFSPIRPELAGKIKTGDIIVAGKNFGCGSSREQAPEIIKALGVAAVIAKSYARIFYRNAMGNGLLVITSDALAEAVAEDEEIVVDLEGKSVKLASGSGNSAWPVSIHAIPENLLDMINAGGLVAYYAKLNAGGKE